MLVGEIIEMLSKKNWKAEVVLDIRPERTNTGFANLHTIDGIHEIKSITESIGDINIVTLNTRDL